MSKEEVLLSTPRSGVTQVTLDRPQARNAYSVEMVELLLTRIEALRRDDSCRVVVLTGSDRAFSAGGDIKAMAEQSGMFAGDPIELRSRYQDGIQAIVRAWNRFEKPVIAAIEGAAIGAGLGLALSCDIRVAANNARFGATFGRLGLVPGDASAYLLGRAIGFSRAVEWVLSARIIDAQEAHTVGLIHQLVSPGDALTSALDRAEEMATFPPRALQLTKASMYRSANADLDTALELVAAFQSMAQRAPEHLDLIKEMVQNK